MQTQKGGAYGQEKWQQTDDLSHRMGHPVDITDLVDQEQDGATI